MIEYTDLSQPIYKRLKEMIRNGELKQGEKIVQEKIAEELGVSRTPLMKALLALENEYLVESIPRRGMYLRVLDYKEIIDIYNFMIIRSQSMQIHFTNYNIRLF